MTTTETSRMTGWEPRAGRRDAGSSSTSRAVTVLRVIAYVTTSLASIVFLALVIYAGLIYYQLRQGLEELFDGNPAVSEPYVPATPEELDQGNPSGYTQFCFANPDDPICAGAN